MSRFSHMFIQLTSKSLSYPQLCNETLESRRAVLGKPSLVSEPTHLLWGPLGFKRVFFACSNTWISLAFGFGCHLA